MRPVAFGEHLPAGTRLALFSEDKPDRFFTVIKFWMDETSGVATAVSKLKLRSTILDGEVVAVDANGIPRFQLLQRFQKQPPRRLSTTMPLTSFGITETTLRVTQSLTVGG